MNKTHSKARHKTSMYDDTRKEHQLIGNQMIEHYFYYSLFNNLNINQPALFAML